MCLKFQNPDLLVFWAPDLLNEHKFHNCIALNYDEIKDKKGTSKLCSAWEQCPNPDFCYKNQINLTFFDEDGSKSEMCLILVLDFSRRLFIPNIDCSVNDSSLKKIHLEVVNFPFHTENHERHCEWQMH